MGLTIACSVSPIVSASYQVDDGKWRSLAPADCIFDAPCEELTFPVAKLPAGEHNLKVKVKDAAGNEATFEFKYQR